MHALLVAYAVLEAVVVEPIALALRLNARDGTSYRELSHVAVGLAECGCARG